jgi:hypothetical protein
MESILTKLTEEHSAADLQRLSRESMAWYTKKISQLRNPIALAKGISQEKSRYTRTFMKGKLYYFVYDPKMKHQLPYYDKFPLTLVLEKYEDGFLGLNMHYLPVKYRIIFLRKLMQFALLDKEDDIKRLRVTYDILNASKRFREFKPCIKRYLFPHIRSRILAVQPNEWETSMYLPVHQFKGEKPQKIWKESMEEIRNS